MGMVIVGERGPELFNWPTGARIYGPVKQLSKISQPEPTGDDSNEMLLCGYDELETRDAKDALLNRPLNTKL